MLLLTSILSAVAHDLPQHLPAAVHEKPLLFISTASEVQTGDKSWLDADRQALIRAGLQLRDFSLGGSDRQSVEQALESASGVVVEGGNTFYLLQCMYESGFDLAVRGLLERGGVYIGSSAGSIAAGPDIQLAADDRALAPTLTTTRGLNLISTTIVPHWGNESSYTARERRLPQMYALPHPIILLADSCYVRSDKGCLSIVDTRGKLP